MGKQYNCRIKRARRKRYEARRRAKQRALLAEKK